MERAHLVDSGIDGRTILRWIFRKWDGGMYWIDLVYYRIHKCHQLSQSLIIVIQSKPPNLTSWRSILILSSHLRLGLPSGLFTSSCPTKYLYKTLLTHIRATCPANLILLDLIARIIFGEQYRSLSSSVCNFLHSLVSDQVSHPYKTTGKIIVLCILLFKLKT